MSRLVATIILFASALAVPAAAQESQLSVEQIVQKHTAALGGADKLRAIQNVTVTGTATLMGGLQAPVVVKAKRPASMRMEMTVQGQTFVQAFDGQTAWIVNPFMGTPDPLKSSEEDTRTARDDADFIEGSLVDYEAKGNAVELAGTEQIEGSPAYKLKVTRKSGSIEFVYLDAHTFLPIKSAGTRTQQGHEIAYESFQGNFKAVHGVMMPFSLTQKMNGRSMMELTVERVEVNTAMKDSIFQMPEQVAPKK